MGQHSSEFFLEINPVFPGIFSYPFGADENVPRKNVANTVVKTNDVGIGVVVQVLLIDLQKVFVVAENKTYFLQLLVFRSDDSFQPCFISRLLLKFKVGLRIKINDLCAQNTLLLFVGNFAAKVSFVYLKFQWY